MSASTKRPTPEASPLPQVALLNELLEAIRRLNGSEQSLLRLQEELGADEAHQAKRERTQAH